jgi:hypothetical protein
MVGAFLAGAVLEAAGSARQARPPALLPAADHDAGVLPLDRPAHRVGWVGSRCWWSPPPCCCGMVFGKLAGVHSPGACSAGRRARPASIGWLLQTKALIMIIFANILLDRQVISAELFTALLLMAAASTMLTIPMITRKDGELRG